MTTHYNMLQVSRNASNEVIEAAWKALMRVYHPDGSAPDDARARAINAAHDVLSDPKRRRKYDQELKAAKAKEKCEAAPKRAGKKRGPVPIFDRRGVNLSAYPAAYPGMVPGLNLDLEGLLQRALRAGGTAAVEKLIEDNPVLKQVFGTRGRKSS